MTAVPRTPIVIVDIDGTVANCAHRLKYIEGQSPKDWDAFYAGIKDDTPHLDICSLVRSLPAPLYFITGRPERTRKATERWLEDHMLAPTLLLMRDDDDHAEDYVVKTQHLDRLDLRPEHIWFILEDRDQVVKAYREKGYRVLQVKDGAY